MNCKHAEELLPLYAGRDLEEERATLVTEHVQTCAACARVADEYRESVQLTQQFAPPVFSEAMYAGIRQRVLREIEPEATGPAWSQTIASLFRPRLTWAFAGVLLIIVSMFAVYFIVNRRHDEQQLTDNKPADIVPSVNTTPKKQEFAGVPQPRRKRSRETLAKRMNTVGAKSTDATSTASNVSPGTSGLSEPMVFPHRDSAALVKTLRVEIQTNDPKIRIIWFVQQETKPVIPSSKGT